MNFILRLSGLGQLVRIKYIAALAFVTNHAQTLADIPSKPSGKNWSKAFENWNLCMLGSLKVLAGKDVQQKDRGARVDRTKVRAVKCISADGRYLDFIITWAATIHRSNWTTIFIPGCYYAYNESGYPDPNISLQRFKRVFDPEFKYRAHARPRK
jgi:hypothetical protein